MLLMKFIKDRSNILKIVYAFLALYMENTCNVSQLALSNIKEKECKNISKG